MLTGAVKNQIDQIWNAFWSGGIANPLEVMDERRFITIGTSQRDWILFVSHTDGADEQIRIISARTATSSEAYDYQESRRPRR